MDKDYQSMAFEYRRSADMDAAKPARHPVVVVGAGPVGLATAIDLARQGVRTVLLDDDNTLSTGSRAICFAKRTLEIFDRLECGEPMAEKGVSWHVGKVFFKDQPLYSFDLLPEEGHRRPAFVNLQQYYVEGYLHDRAVRLPALDLRWRSRVTGLEQRDDHVELTVSTPDGDYRLRADYVVAADGGRSPLRAMLGQESKGRVFRDRFLIADVKMKADFPTERWFWFDPPFHPGQSVLLHRQPDNVWRIDFQLGWDADPELEKTPERVIPRIKALLGEHAEFELEWMSVYTFCCLRMDSFRHGRVLFAGDAAHGVSPFGARGANSGVQDADNLAWKLKLVLEGKAPSSLLDTYASEREYAADENILNSTRATDFITPKSAISRVFRDAVLSLAKDHAFARKLVNSGRLSVPAVYGDSPLNTADGEPFAPSMRPGSPCLDAPVTVDGAADWFLSHVGDGFTAVCFTGGAVDAARAEAMRTLAAGAIPVRTLLVAPPGRGGPGLLEDRDGLLAARYDARPGTCYLLRPDQHVCARWRSYDAGKIGRAVARATHNPQEVAA
ncbi:FAD-dependent oxidoreductase [Pseudoduganella namucuonensis]|uniref:3-(3-hydroxy-phenyl)propionate hydroxylase n=1 Tax=Pseudoduganella namucuonensis TaxID=1035707 RepID=A0A1I7LZA5_9BURK|nr:FAD-dependent oxidoreductase [Pseudoduganella namucuonensis]SFV14937.1 3-(3-hydroxy-phenyl)propionate hydroxylase [Pseudoduganella namucuonensis]